MSLSRKIGLAVIAMVLLSVGLSILVELNMGLAPYDTLTYVVQYTFKIEQFGNAALLLHSFFAVILVIFFVSKKKSLVPIGVSLISIFVLTRIINLLSFVGQYPVFSEYRYISFVIGLLLMAISVLIMGKVNLIIPPYDKVPAEISLASGIELGKVRLVSDVTILIIAVVWGSLNGTLPAVTIGTLVIAFGLGSIMSIIDRMYQNLKARVVKEQINRN